MYAVFNVFLNMLVLFLVSTSIWVGFRRRKWTRHEAQLLTDDDLPGQQRSQIIGLLHLLIEIILLAAAGVLIGLTSIAREVGGLEALVGV